MSRVLLQICTAVLALVPVSTGVITMRGVRDPLYRALHLPEVPVLDSNLRFFGGVWLGLGLAMLWTVPSIELQGTLFRWLWVAVFLGGVGRLLSLVDHRGAAAPLHRLPAPGDRRRSPVHLLAMARGAVRGFLTVREQRSRRSRCAVASLSSSSPGSWPWP